MENQLIKYIKEDLAGDPNLRITVDTKLITTGIIDSFSLVALQAFIEKEFGKRVPAERITPQTFDTIGQIIKIINEH